MSVTFRNASPRTAVKNYYFALPPPLDERIIPPRRTVYGPGCKRFTPPNSCLNSEFSPPWWRSTCRPWSHATRKVGGWSPPWKGITVLVTVSRRETHSGSPRARGRHRGAIGGRPISRAHVATTTPHPRRNNDLSNLPKTAGHVYFKSNVV